MGYQCKGFCKDFEKVSRKKNNVSMCDPCEYSTITEATYCPCCGKKYRTRKTGKTASELRLDDNNRI